MAVNLLANIICVYLISCVHENSLELPASECPKDCYCYDAPPPLSFDDDGPIDKNKSINK